MTAIGTGARLATTEALGHEEKSGDENREAFDARGDVDLGRGDPGTVRPLGRLRGNPPARERGKARSQENNSGTGDGEDLLHVRIAS
jgi:hypothetical protein